MAGVTSIQVKKSLEELAERLRQELITGPRIGVAGYVNKGL